MGLGGSPFEDDPRAGRLPSWDRANSPPKSGLPCRVGGPSKQRFGGPGLDHLVQVHGRQQRSHLAHDRHAELVNHQRLVQGWPHRAPPAQRRSEPWTTMHLARQCLAALFSLGRVPTVDADLSTGRRLQPDDGTRHRGLAAAGLPTTPCDSAARTERRTRRSLGPAAFPFRRTER